MTNDHNDRRKATKNGIDKFVWNEIWKGLLSPGTILTLYLLSKCTNFYTMPSKFDTDNYSPIHYPEAFHTLYK